MYFINYINYINYMIYWLLIFFGTIILSLSLSNPFYNLIIKKNVNIGFFPNIMIRAILFFISIVIILIALFVQSVI